MLTSAVRALLLTKVFAWLPASSPGLPLPGASSAPLSQQGWSQAWAPSSPLTMNIFPLGLWVQQSISLTDLHPAILLMGTPLGSPKSPCYIWQPSLLWSLSFIHCALGTSFASRRLREQSYLCVHLDICKSSSSHLTTVIPRCESVS